MHTPEYHGPKDALTRSASQHACRALPPTAVCPTRLIRLNPICVPRSVKNDKVLIFGYYIYYIYYIHVYAFSLIATPLNVAYESAMALPFQCVVPSFVHAYCAASHSVAHSARLNVVCMLCAHTTSMNIIFPLLIRSKSEIKKNKRFSHRMIYLLNLLQFVVFLLLYYITNNILHMYICAGTASLIPDKSFKS